MDDRERIQGIHKEISEATFVTRKCVYGTGIDEIVCMSNFLPSADIVKDGNVNFCDFAVLAASWMLDVNKPGFDSDADLNGDNIINLTDTDLFSA